MSTKQEEFWKQYSKENNCVLFKGDWDQFCKAKNIDEESLKKLLFKGELSENEFQSVVFCIIITVPFESPSLFYPVLFKKCPQLIERCNWDMLNNLDWLILLEKYPQFADKFDKWDEFDGEDWSCLLCEQPQFADKCDKWDEIDSEDWVELLCSQPQFADKCNKWEELDEQDWANLLSEKPQFADKCNWDSLKGIGWCRLLATQPQFADKCDWDKLDGSAWGYLLSEQPQFADKCDVWDYLDAAQWESLLKHQPQLVDKCAKSSIVVNVLIKHPQFTEHCNTSIITEKGKAKLLAKHPDLVKYFPEKTKTIGLDSEKYMYWKNYCKERGFEDVQSAIRTLFKDVTSKEIPHLTDKLSPGGFYFDYYWLFDEFPEFIQRCNWDMLNSNDWKELLRFKPEFSDKCAWSKLKACDWSELLVDQPQFADKCDKWDDFDDMDWWYLLDTQPQFADKCDWSKLDSLDTYHWSELLQEQPQFADECNKWDEFNENEKEELIDAHPNLAKYFK